MTPVIKSEEIINQIRQLQDELNKMARSLVTFPTKSKQNRMKKIDDTLSVYWKYLHTLYPEITSEDIADYENLPSRSMDATVGAEVHKSYSSVFNNPDKSLIQDDLDKSRRLNNGTIQKENDMDKLQHYLNQFKDGKLVIRVDSSIAYYALDKILNKHNMSIIIDSEQIDNLYRYPFLTVGEDGYVNLYKNMNEAYQVDIREKVDISELECLDMLQDFKNGKLVVQLINGYQYEKFISYLKENGIAISSKTEYTQNPSHFPYFYMLRPGVLTAGESYEAIKNYIHINKLVPLGVFMPAFEKMMKEANKVKEVQSNDFADFTAGRLIIHINNSMEHRLFLDYLKEQGLFGKLYPDIKQYNKDNAYFYMYKGKLSGDILLTAVRDISTHFKECYKDMAVKEFCNVDFANNTKIQEMKAEPEETVPLSAYEKVMAERNQAFAQLNALGISFGEDPKFTQKRIEDTVIEKFSAGIADSICEYLDTNPNPDDRDGVIHGLLRGKSLEDLIDIDKDDEREI